MDQTQAIREVVDQPAIDRDGEDVGRVVDIFIDEETEAPKWAALQIDDRDTLVLAPIRGADLEARPFRLDVDRARVLSAPTVSSREKHISPEEEAEIEHHYHGSRDDQATDSERSLATDSTVDVDRPLGSGGESPIEVVRSEEDLVVETRIAGSERVRLIKRIVTEQVTRTVEVRHEELVVEREPLAFGSEPGLPDTTDVAGSAGPPATRRERLTERLKERLPSLPAGALGKIGASAGASGAFSGETTEITLMQEEIVISKRIVPRERVRVRKEVVTEQRQLSETLRKEQVEISEGRRDLGTSDGHQTTEPIDRDQDAEGRPLL